MGQNTRRVTKADLPEHGNGSGIFLYCPTCGERYSPDRGDYWHVGDSEVMHCRGDKGRRHRERNLMLVREERTLVAI